MAVATKETWGSGDPYENYVGRWSRRVGKEFLAGLNLPSSYAGAMLAAAQAL